MIRCRTSYHIAYIHDYGKFLNQQVRPNIDKNIQFANIDVEHFQGHRFAEKLKTWGAPLPRKGFVKLTSSLQIRII